MRVVSLACSNTEIVWALGLSHLLVGCDDHSDFPEEVVGALPRVGPDLQIDVERVRALRPDLVLASLTVPGHERNVAALEAAGLPYLAPEPVSLADVSRDVRSIAAALGEPRRGEALAASLDAEWRSAPPPGPRPRVLVEWWPKPVIAPGRQSWVTQLLELAGGVNPLAERDVKSTPLTNEDAAALRPDASVISWCGVPTAKYRPKLVAQRPGWEELELVRRGHIYCVPEAYLGRPGPRLVEGLRALREVVRAVAG